MFWRVCAGMQLVRLWTHVGGALLVLAAGALHLYLYFDYFHRVHVVGPLFLLNAAAAAIIGLFLFLSSHPVAAAAGVLYAAGTLAAFLVSVYHSLFGYVERLTGAWQEAAAGLEIAAIVLLLPLAVGLRQRSRQPDWWRSHQQTR